MCAVQLKGWVRGLVEGWVRGLVEGWINDPAELSTPVMVKIHNINTCFE